MQAKATIYIIKGKGIWHVLESLCGLNIVSNGESDDFWKGKWRLDHTGSL